MKKGQAFCLRGSVRYANKFAYTTLTYSTLRQAFCLRGSVRYANKFAYTTLTYSTVTLLVRLRGRSTFKSLAIPM